MYRLLAACAVACVLIPITLAQSREKKKDRDQPSGQQLQQRADKAEAALLQELIVIADEFEKQEEHERAIEILERISKLRSKAPEIETRIRLLREKLLAANGLRTEIDVSRGWGGQPVAEVQAGKPFRISAAGEYKLNFVATIPVTGLVTDDPTRDHVADAPFGALIGVVVSDRSPGTPFAVRSGAEVTPKKSGLLFLRVNVPAAAKCTGKIEIQLSGGIAPVTKR